MTESAEPNPGLAFWRTVKKIDKSKINHRWMALRNSLAVAVPLGAGMALGNPLAAVAVATGALNVSYSDGRDPYFQRAQRMLTWSVLGALAVFTGCITGSNAAAAITVAACWAFLAGMLLVFGQRAGDLGLNTLVALVVFAGRGATTFQGALDTSLLVLGGGLLQCVFCLAFWPLRRYEPERRAVGKVFANLSKEVDPDSDSRDAGPLSQRSADEDDTIAALGNDHSMEGERFRLLFDQADRLRLSSYLVERLRDQLGERDNQRTEAEGEAAELLERVLRLAAKVLQAAGTKLADTGQKRVEFGASRLELESLIGAAHALQTGGGVAAAANMAAAVDVLAGQLRLVMQLVENAERAAGEAGERAAMPDLRAQISGWLQTLEANLDVRSAVCRHAIRLSLCVAVGDWMERTVSWQRAYWLPMTVAVVLKPDFTSTFSRGVLRLLGTFLGLVLATALFHLLPNTALAELLLVGAFTFCLRYWGPANYGLFSVAITGLVVFLIAETGNSPGDAVAARALNTVAGGLLALAAYAVWPTWERTQVSDSMAELIEASRLYLQGLFGQLGAATTASNELEGKRLEWRRARSNAEASVDRVVSEPGITGLRKETLLSMLASSHGLMLAMTALEAGMTHSETRSSSAALQTFAHDVDYTLYFLSSALRGSKRASEALPELREDHRKLVEARGSLAASDGYVLAETDRLTVSLNTLREQVMRFVRN